MDLPLAADVIVAGATLEGCFTALALARRGARVVLVEASPYLASDRTACLRLWLRGEAAPGPLREFLLPGDEASEVDLEPDGGVETALFRGTLRKQFLRALDEAGVTTLLLWTPAALLGADGEVRGLLMAGKQGLVAVGAGLVVEATARTTLVRQWTGLEPAGSAAGPCRYTLGFAGVGAPATAELPVPAPLGLAGDRVALHAGRNSACSQFVEFGFAPATAEAGRTARAADELTARRLAAELTAYLVGNVPGFAKATLVEVAATVFTPRVGCLAPLVPGLAEAPPGLGPEASWKDLEALQATCSRFADTVWRGRRPASSSTGVTVAGLGGPRPTATAEFLRPVATAPDPALGLPVLGVEVTEPAALPTGASCAVLVAGGGTAGAGAALAAREAGADVLLLEMLSDLGGTQTLGLVTGYYHGYRGGFTARLDGLVSALGQRLHHGRPGDRRMAKLLTYLLTYADAGGRWLPGTVVCGAWRGPERHLRGVVAADADGLFRVAATVSVDATGDGDLAALSGVPARFGDPRTGTAQDYSQWGLGRGGWESRSADLDVFDQRLPSECMRALRLGHRRGRWYDFAAFPTVREGRHIEGEVTLDLRDILSGREVPDTLAVACTDWDPHGISTAWFGRLGFLPVHTALIPVRIPWRCCIPRGWTGLLVSAKAISATTDAACLCRMAPDVQNLGYATGLAAASTAREGAGDPRRIDAAALTDRLRERGIVTDALPAPWPTPPEATTILERLVAGDEMALRDAVLLAPAEVLPELQAAWRRGPAIRLPLAQALAWFGDPVGGEELLAALRRLLPSAALPYDDTHPHKAGNPRAGMVDQLDDYWRLNQLLALVGIARVPGAAPLAAAVAAVTTAGGPAIRALNPYIRERIDMQRVPHFDRLLNLAFCAERLADPDLGASLAALLDRDGIGGHVTTDLLAAGRLYHGALAEVWLAAAAARCGARAGAARLIQFLGDVHEILVRFALTELQAVSGLDFGRDEVAWTAWLASVAALTPSPFPPSAPAF